MSAILARRWSGLILVVIALDQATKLYFHSNFRLGERVNVLPFFDWILAYNPGAAFSFLANAGGWQRWFFVGVGIAVSIVLAGLLWRGVASRLETAAYVGLIGGALGNVADRLRLGAVVDYLDLHWRGMHWPAFNLADMLVVGSAGLLVLASFVQAPPSPQPQP